MRPTWSSGQAKWWSSSFFFFFLGLEGIIMAKHRKKTCKFPYCLNICFVKCFVESFAKDRRSRQNRSAHSFKFFHNKHFQGNSGRSFSKKLIQVMMSLTISEALCRDKRWLAEKISARFLSGNKNSTLRRVLSVYKACRHIFCRVSRFLFSRICVLPTSKELHPNHYNEMSSTRNGYLIPQTLCSFFFFSNIGLFIKQLCHLVQVQVLKISIGLN